MPAREGATVLCQGEEVWGAKRRCGARPIESLGPSCSPRHGDRPPDNRWYFRGLDVSKGISREHLDSWSPQDAFYDLDIRGIIALAHQKARENRPALQPDRIRL